LVELEILEDELAPYIKNLRGQEQFVKTLRKRLELESELNRAYNKRTRSKLKKEIRALTQRLDSAFYRAFPQRDRALLRRENRKFRRKVKAYDGCSCGSRPSIPWSGISGSSKTKRPSWRSWVIWSTMKLTSAGIFASQIHGHELMITEMFMEGAFPRLSSRGVERGHGRGGLRAAQE